MDASAPAVMRDQTAQALQRPPTAKPMDLGRVRRAREVLHQQDVANARAEGEAAGRREGYAAGVETANLDTWWRAAKVGMFCGIFVGGLGAAVLFRVFTAIGRATGLTQ